MWDQHEKKSSTCSTVKRKFGDHEQALFCPECKNCLWAHHSLMWRCHQNNTVRIKKLWHSCHCKHFTRQLSLATNNTWWTAKSMIMILGNMMVVSCLPRLSSVRKDDVSDDNCCMPKTKQQQELDLWGVVGHTILFVLQFACHANFSFVLLQGVKDFSCHLLSKGFLRPKKHSKKENLDNKFKQISTFGLNGNFSPVVDPEKGHWIFSSSLSTLLIASCNQTHWHLHQLLKRRWQHNTLFLSSQCCQTTLQLTPLELFVNLRFWNEFTNGNQGHMLTANVKLCQRDKAIYRATASGHAKVTAITKK